MTVQTMVLDHLNPIDRAFLKFLGNDYDPQIKTLTETKTSIFDVLSGLEDELESEFEEFRYEIENEIKDVSAADMSSDVDDFYPITRPLAELFTLDWNVDVTVEVRDLPDFELCAVRLVSHFCEEHFGGVHVLLEAFEEQRRWEAEVA